MTDPTRPTARQIFSAAGFVGEALDIALGVAYAESAFGFSDAVGDISLINDKWGPSIGLFQIRSLRKPQDFPSPDSLRIAEKLRDPAYNATTAYAIWKKYGWSPWSVYKSGSYLKYKGQDWTPKVGHPRAEDWDV